MPITGLILLYHIQLIFAGSVDEIKIVSCFAQYDSLCKVDDGKLWGKSLYGPLLIIDKSNKIVYSNIADNNGHFTKTGSYYTGTLPDSLALGNTANEWMGIYWTQITLDRLQMFPNQGSSELLMHEAFHRLQRELSLDLSYKEMPHLSTMNGRFWLIMEHKALLAALQQEGKEREKAVRDALLFRNYRYSLFSEAVESEKALEAMEGTAQYTGKILAGYTRQSILQVLEHDVKGMPESDLLARKYAYTSGLLYGLLLDDKCPNWRFSFTSLPDYGKQLQSCYSVKIPSNLTKRQVNARISIYDGKALLFEEQEREKKKEEVIQKYKKMFFENKTYVISLEKAINFTITADLILPLEFGTVYNGLRFVADWGVLDIFGQSLLAPDFNKVYLPYDVVETKDNEVSSRTWKITFNEGYVLKDITVP